MEKNNSSLPKVTEILSLVDYLTSNVIAKPEFSDHHFVSPHVNGMQLSVNLCYPKTYIKRFLRPKKENIFMCFSIQYPEYGLHIHIAGGNRENNYLWWDVAVFHSGSNKKVGNKYVTFNQDDDINDFLNTLEDAITEIIDCEAYAVSAAMAVFITTMMETLIVNGHDFHWFKRFTSTVNAYLVGDDNIEKEYLRSYNELFHSWPNKYDGQHLACEFYGNHKIVSATSNCNPYHARYILDTPDIRVTVDHDYLWAYCKFSDRLVRIKYDPNEPFKMLTESLGVLTRISLVYSLIAIAFKIININKGSESDMDDIREEIFGIPEEDEE